MAAKTTGNVKTVKGLQLTTAQQAAYNKAYSAAATAARTRLALASAAQGFRKYRLQAANATVAKANIARGAAQTAAIAAYAARRSYVQSRLAHQNTALLNRIELDMYNHANLAGRLQYIQAGEKAYAHSAVMRTVDTAQAVSYEAKIFASVAKTATKAAKSTLPLKAGPNSKAIAAAANAAGLKAAKAVPKNAVAPAVAKTRTAPLVTGWAAYAQAMYGGQTRMAVPQTERKWIGDEGTANCIIAAVANHLLYTKSLLVDDQQVKQLTEDCGPKPTIESVLWQVYLTGWPFNGRVRLHNYREVEHPAAEGDGLVIGYEITRDDGTKGDHCALSLYKGEVISWGSVNDRESLVEEAWVLEWES